MNNYASKFTYLYMLILFMIWQSAIIPYPARASDPQVTSLRLGFTSGTLYDVDINDARAAQAIWLEAVLKNVNQDEQDIGITSTLFNNVPTACAAIEKNDIDVIICLPIEYLALPKTLNITPIFTSSSGTNLGEHYVLITHKQKNIQNLEQLKSLKLLMSQKGNNEIAKLWLDTLLLENRLPISETFFSTTKNVRKTTQAILPVFFKQADVCLIPKTDFEIAKTLNPQLDVDLQILAQSPGFNRVIVCVQDNFYNEFGDRLDEAIKAVHQTTQGTQLLTLFRVSQMVRFESTHLDNIKKLVQTYQTLSQKSALPTNEHLAP